MTLHLVAVFLNQEAGYLVSAAFLLQEEETGMCRCLGGLYGLFADLV